MAQIMKGTAGKVERRPVAGCSEKREQVRQASGGGDAARPACRVAGLAGR